VTRSQRCAIYTRKSTEDGLEQEFNSLDAQREACAAYVLSQRHEGWTLLPDLYDDGGFSGGSMERPGLKRLLTDIEAGRVDTIIVYKVDRLTRSLADFAKIVDVLDAAGASFVSITQSFNTTTSMGRLTLNVLLSFAQFEREVTGERIRDKIAASKKKGLWMGGPVPLGYDVCERKLVVNENEAEVVRHIYRTYLELGSVKELIGVLAREGARTKVQVRTSTGHRGGIAFGRGCLFHLLKNRIYLGEIVHKGAAYPGEHEAIVPLELWTAVQERLAERARIRVLGNGADHPSLLAGIIRDGEGRSMSPSHANKGPRRYRYYVTHESHVSQQQPAWRVAAHDLEAIIVNRLAEHLGDPAASISTTDQHRGDADRRVEQVSRARDLLATGTASEKRQVLLDHVTMVSLHEDRIAITLAGGNPHGDSKATRATTLTVAAVRVRRGHDIRLVIAGPAPAVPKRDVRLVQLVADAIATRDRLQAMGDVSIAKAAAWLGCCRTTLTDRIKLSYLAPDIIEAILAGRQPRSLTRRRLASIDLPIDWRQQRQMLGFG
jgi:DNA invertase Pin-like site-specific DNA recombinase